MGSSLSITDTLVPLGRALLWPWISEGGSLALSPPLALRWGSCVGWAFGCWPNPWRKDLIREPLLEAPRMTSPRHHLEANKTRAWSPRRTFLRKKTPDYRPSQEAYAVLCSLKVALRLLYGHTLLGDRHQICELRVVLDLGAEGSVNASD